MDDVDVLVVRQAKFGGVDREVGETLSVPANIAATLIADGRVRLVDVADLGPVIDAEEARARGVWRDRRPRWPRMLLR